jgi:hypothetical protein
LLGAGIAAAAFVSADDGSPTETITRVRTAVSTVSDTASTFTVTETTTVPADEPAQETVPEPGGNGASLNDAGFELMQQERFEEALPLLEQAVEDLQNEGSLAEAYASYNLAFTRLALGSCDGVLELLDRSESVQGARREIDRLRRDAERTCDGGGNQGRGDEDD